MAHWCKMPENCHCEGPQANSQWDGLLKRALSSEHQKNLLHHCFQQPIASGTSSRGGIAQYYLHYTTMRYCTVLPVLHYNTACSTVPQYYLSDICEGFQRCVIAISLGPA